MLPLNRLIPKGPLVTGTCLLFASGCDRAPLAPLSMPAIPVMTAVAQREDMPVRIRAVGAVESVSEVTLRPQVAGQVKELHFKEGDQVPAGALLVSLDPRPFDAALKEAEAAVVRCKALAADAESAATQMEQVRQDRAASPREVEASKAKADAARADVEAAEAAIDTAKLNREYCTIKAPFAGRLGAAMVRTGAIVKANETPLVDLVQIHPIDISFTIREQDLGSVKVGQGAAPLQATVSMPGSPDDSIQATLWFLDNRIDSATGQVRLKARYANDDERLWPGQFVNVLLTTSTDKNVVTVPARAVQISQQGAYTYVVGADGTVSMRAVDIRRMADGRAILEKGLEAGETVVTEGQLRLTPGAKVAPRQPAGAVAGAAR